MVKARNKKNTASKKVGEQDLKTIGQENLHQSANDGVKSDGDRVRPSSTDTAEDKSAQQDTTVKTVKPQRSPTSFVGDLANRVMVRIYELYGYSIKGDLCKIIISRAQQYAKANNININTDIEAINTHELYDYIVGLISNGYNISPLDTTYNDIFLRAVVERYKR
jgi:hypothetical protein